MTRPSEKSIFDLNTDCLIHVCSFLQPLDRLQLAIVSNAFDDAVMHFIQSDRIAMTDVINAFSVNQFKILSERFGPLMKRIDCYVQLKDDSTLSNDQIKRYCKHISTYCQNIEHLSIYHPWQPDYYTIVRIFQNARRISKVCIISSNQTPGRTSVPNQFDIQLNGLFADLRLERLDLSYQRDLLGKCLPRCRHLRELNLEFCDMLEPKYLNGLFQVAKLKTLNIIDCSKLTDNTFEILCATQTELEKLAISNNYRCRYLEIVGRLESLQHIEFHDFSSEALNLRQLLDELVEHHASDLQTLEMHSGFIYSIPATDILRAIAKFKVLKTLVIPDIYPVHEEFIKFIRNSHQLEKLTIVADSGAGIDEKIFMEIVAMKSLNYLRIITDTTVLPVSLLKPVYEILKTKCRPLELHLDERSFDTSFLDTPEYKEYEKFMKIYVNEVDLDDMLTNANLF